jgi:hypothetical protein
MYAQQTVVQQNQSRFCLYPMPAMFLFLYMLCLRINICLPYLVQVMTAMHEHCPVSSYQPIMTYTLLWPLLLLLLPGPKEAKPT